MRILAPAKLNLFLRILAREESGYHGIETAFLGIDHGDRLEIRPRERPGVDLTVSGEAGTGSAERNLAFLAAGRFLAAAGLSRGVEIHLEKRVPVGGGLGGGSSDAAAVLRVLDHLHPGRVPPRELLGIAADLGSDVPFFLAPTPYALAWNRGDRMLALDPPPSRPVLLACPAAGVATADAYRHVATRGIGHGPVALDMADLRRWEGLAALQHNDFTPYVHSRVEAAAPLIAGMREAGATVAGVTGSGSTLFGVFGEKSIRDDATERLAPAHSSVRFIPCRTLEQWPATDG